MFVPCFYCYSGQGCSSKGIHHQFRADQGNLPRRQGDQEAEAPQEAKGSEQTGRVRSFQPSTSNRHADANNAACYSWTFFRYISAYNYWVGNVRPQMLTMYPDLVTANNNAINKILGSAWKNIDKETLSYYSKLSTQDKQRYLREMRVYEPSEGHEREIPRIRDDESATSADEGSKRKRTSYNAFIDQERSNLVNSKMIGKQLVVQMSTSLGERWRSMPAEEKQLYVYAEEGSNDAPSEDSPESQDSAKRRKVRSMSPKLDFLSTVTPDFSRFSIESLFPDETNAKDSSLPCKASPAPSAPTPLLFETEEHHHSPSTPWPHTTSGCFHPYDTSSTEFAAMAF